MPKLSGGSRQDLVARERREGGASCPGRDRDEGRCDQQCRDVAGQLLDGDERTRERRGHGEVEAAPAGLAGEGRGEGQDRPESCQERQVGAVVPGDEAADRAHVQRVAVQTAHHRRQRRGERIELATSRQRPVGARHLRAACEDHEAEHATDDEHAEP